MAMIVMVFILIANLQYGYLVFDQTAQAPSPGRVKYLLGIKFIVFIPSDYFTLPGLGLGAVWIKTRYRYCIFYTSVVTFFI